MTGEINPAVVVIQTELATTPEAIYKSSPAAPVDQMVGRPRYRDRRLLETATSNFPESFGLFALLAAGDERGTVVVDRSSGSWRCAEQRFLPSIGPTRALLAEAASPFGRQAIAMGDHRSE